MPSLADFIRSDKANVKTGEWKQGHILPSAFPLSHSRKKHFKFGQDYAWRLVRFDALGYPCRVLILLNEGKQIMRATFGVEVKGDMTVLCSHESHGDHPGLHCHLHTAPLDDVEPGVFRAPRRWPASKVQTIKDLNLTKEKVLSLVADRFKFASPGGML